MRRKKEPMLDIQEPLSAETQKVVSSVETQELSVGDMLKKARVKKKKEIEKIAEALYIRPRYLEALEESRYFDFPGQAYAVGFLKNYALYLGLDAETLITKYHQETSFIKPQTLNMPMSEHPTLFPSIKYVAWGVGILVLFWLFWYLLTYKEITEDAMPTISVVQEVVAPVEVPVVETVVEEPVVPPEEPKAEPVQTAVKKVQKDAVQIVALEEVWVEIEHDDTLILSKTLKKGETYDVPASDAELFLKTGNAGGMEILVGGQKVKSLGPVGAVRSGISLSADKLRKR